MGCGGTKSAKPDSKLNSPQNQSNQAAQLVNLAQAPILQETEKIESDYIFHVMDPLVSNFV
ncbi:unnamed protein product [Paramecium sonneborni]|uniref:Uncharacterized protein n=1 Tax=Paramecium sonneborni TaxID=65129 RepID=A0A8S1MZF9_9CILI|nr:unnamed protein product [Paramecium sonneborni]